MTAVSGERVISYVPAPCQGDDAAFEGCIELAIPKYTERMAWLEQAGFKVGPKGEVDFGIEQMPAVRKMAEIAKSRVRLVALTKKADGVKYSSWDDLEFDPDCDQVILDVALKMLNGFRPGKN